MEYLFRVRLLLRLGAQAVFLSVCASSACAQDTSAAAFLIPTRGPVQCQAKVGPSRPARPSSDVHVDLEIGATPIPTAHHIEAWFDSTGSPLSLTSTVINNISTNTQRMEMLWSMFVPGGASGGFFFSDTVQSGQRPASLADKAHRKALDKSQLQAVRTLAEWVWQQECVPRRRAN